MGKLPTNTKKDCNYLCVCVCSASNNWAIVWTFCGFVGKGQWPELKVLFLNLMGFLLYGIYLL